MAKKNNNNNKKNNNQSKDKDISNNKKQTTAEKSKNDILKQYGLEDDYVPSEKEQEVLETQREGQRVKGKVHCQADDEGWNNPKQLLKNAGYGLLMGISDSVPGYSGGTTLSLFGFYDKLISNIKMIFKPDVKKYFWKYLVWFLPFAIAWIGMLIGFMFLVREAGKNNAGVALVFLFGSFAFFSIPLFYIKNKEKLSNLPKILGKKKEQTSKTSIIAIVLVVIGFLVVITVGLVARFVATNNINNEVVKGVSFSQHSFDISTIINQDTASTVIPLLIFSFIAGFVMLIPGISGSLVLFMANWYPKLSGMITNILQGTSTGEEAPYLVVVVLGIVLGLVVSSFAINWITNKFEKWFYNLSFGLVMGSFVSIFVSLSSYDYGFLSQGSTLGISIAMIFVGLILNAIVFIVLNETKKIDYPKYRIFKKEAKNAKAN